MENSFSSNAVTVKEQSAVHIFNDCQVRTVEIDNTIFFVGKDVCAVLGYKDYTNAMKQHCRGVVKRHPISDSLNRTQNVRVLSESDVMRLICSSQLPEAVNFEKWVFEEVLPAVRKHGGYLTPAKVEEAILNPDVLIQLATELKTERAKRIEAERTKACISDKKTATALATASHAVRRLNTLEDQIGIGKTWKRLTCVPWLDKYFDPQKRGTWSAVGRYLTALSAQMHLPAKNVPDEKYGSVKAYHITVLEEFHRLVKNDSGRTILPYYRKFNVEG